jgi:signal transduction histidine kinase
VEASTEHWQALTDTDGDTVGWQFQRPGLASRVAPFGLVAAVAALSVLVPDGDVYSWPEYVTSVALLFACAGTFLLPWQRLPAWTPVLVPLLYAGSVLELMLASGVTSGVGIVLLVPLIWSALFHRRWESACVVVAVVAVQLVSSVAQATPGDVVLRRVLLWSALGGLIAVAAHGLRDRVHASLVANAALQAEVRELSLARERDRIAADLGESVVRRIFEAGLDLHGTAAMIGEGPAQRRLMRGVAELDAVIRALRESVFDLSDETDAAATDAGASEGPGPDGR